MTKVYGQRNGARGRVGDGLTGYWIAWVSKCSVKMLAMMGERGDPIYSGTLFLFVVVFSPSERC